MEYEFGGEIWEWRGPAPHHFVTVPPAASAAIEATSSVTSYGWGCIPVSVRVGGTEFTTALIPRAGCYALPLKAAVRRAEGLGPGDHVDVHLVLDV